MKEMSPNERQEFIDNILKKVQKQKQKAFSQAFKKRGIELDFSDWKDFDAEYLKCRRNKNNITGKNIEVYYIDDTPIVSFVYDYSFDLMNATREELERYIHTFKFIVIC